MYSKHETAILKQAFWTALGQYLKPVPSHFSEKVNWLNYRTGMKYVFFRMQATKEEAFIAITITHPHEESRYRIFEKFQQLQPMLEAEIQEPWIWNKNAIQENGTPVCTIGISLLGVSFKERENWPALISFFKPRMLALDCFWAEAKDIVEMALN